MLMGEDSFQKVKNPERTVHAEITAPPTFRVTQKKSRPDSWRRA